MAAWSSSRAKGVRGTRWAILFLAFSGGIVHHLSVKSISSHAAPKIHSAFLRAVTNCSFKANLVPSAIIWAPSRPSQRARTSSVVKTRSRCCSAAGARTARQGVTVTMSLLTAKLNILRITASVRFAMMRAPRSTIPSSSRITSRRVIPPALRRPHSESTSFSRIRASSLQDRFRGLAHFSRYSSAKVATVEALRLSAVRLQFRLPGSIPCSNFFTASE